MNIEALTKDLDAVFQKHGISGPLQRCMQIAFCSGLSPYQEHLFTQLLAGGSLFVIGDSGAISAGGLRPSKNAKMLKDVLNAVTPEQFGRLMHMILEELKKAGAVCQCAQCVSKRATTEGSIN